ncbi:pyridoxal phosphate-dependent aminotransferase [Parasynechococcus marenigrum]|uniref:Aminotransferase n=1 Tax=Parasynechococcus marenigrum (strain WH8102) TaxID=84588 RepID=Q7U715_PARMW|nr:pyridoxal phosphate-dependent aminotransferase [Parasynechococcus marenigrum]CAE07686.1 Aminotransferases class-I [Parasynechococcus marenigrum WH 8102]
MPRPPELSARAVGLKPSLTLAIGAQAKALQQAGRDICSLSAGEPDFDTPDFIVEATRQALRDGITRYGPAAGDPELRAAVAEKLSSGNGIAITPEQVLITNGGKQAIYNLFQVLLNPDDEVLLPAPYWLSYPEMAALAGAKVKLIPTQAEEGFRLDLAAVEAAISPRSRLLLLNSPGNPTGRVMKRQELEDVAELVRRHPQLLVMSDEIYEFLLAEGEQHHSFAAIAPDLADRCFTVNGFAKGWAMTGWRLGYLAGHQDVIKAAAALQSQSTSNVCSFAQRGALAAIQGPRACVSAMAESYNRRRQLLTEGLQAIEGITLVEPRGAFYAFPQLPESAGGSMDFCSRALEQAGLAVVPGLAFGNDRCIRLSCAVSRETIRDGLSRLTQLLDET